MKVEVLNRYVDRDKKRICEVGSILEYPTPRAKELIDNGHVKAAPVRKAEKKNNESEV